MHIALLFRITQRTMYAFTPTHLLSLALLFQIWTPNLTLGNPSRRVADFNVELTKIRLLYNGTVILMPGDVFHTRCEYDIYKYPFDKQSCYLSFVSWPHTVNEVLLTIPKNEIVTPFFRENGEWYLRSSSVGSYVKSSLSVAQFSLNLERRSEFFIVNIILPIVSICFLACLVFLIPHESGERIAYTITVLLSFAVFMTLVSDNIPKTSAPMSLLCYYLFALFFGSVLIMLSVVFTSRLFHKDKSVPVCAPYRYLACLLCKRNKKTKRKINKIHVISINESDVPGDMKEDLSKEEKTSKGAGKSGTSETQVTWKEVAEAMDRLCFVMFVVYFTILSGVVVLSVQL